MKEELLFIPLILGSIVILWTERKDVHCPTFESNERECRERGGMSFADSKPNSSDTSAALLEKILKSGTFSSRTILWRKAALLSLGINAALWFLYGYPRIPNFRSFIIATLITFIIIYFFLDYYNYHLAAIPESWLRTSVEILKSRGI